MTDVFSQLPRMSFRGIELPVTTRRVSFEHENVRHKFIFKDNEIIEALGHKNWLFEYTIPFREDIAKGPYKNLYVTTFPKFVRACRDRKEGDLVDPVLGTFTVRPVNFETSTDILRRDGEDAKVAFLHSPAPDEIEELGDILSGVQGAVGTGRQLEQEVAQIADAALLRLGLGQFAGPPDTGANFLDQISGFGQQVIAQTNRVAAGFHKMAHKAEKIENTLDQLNELAANPQNSPVARSARRLRDSANRLSSKALAPGQKLTPYAVPQDITIGQLAAQFGLSMTKILAINPTMPIPLIPAGTIVYKIG